MGLNTDSSPFQSSPLEGATSPRLFWQNRNNENNPFGRGSPSPTRRGSIERLQKASRVRNSNILALEQKQEYDPTKIPQVERPLSKIQGNSFGGSGISGYRDNTAFAHSRSESQTRIPIYSPRSPASVTRSPDPSRPPLTRSPPPNGPRPASRDQASPTKSSLKSSIDKDNGTDSDETALDEHELPFGRGLHRYAKSVTFDNAPPQVNEYEMATPDVSSIATSSREGSYDSADDDEDENPYFMGSDAHEDSFDECLEDTVKTPVVLPDDWRQDDTSEDEFETGHLPEGFPSFAPGGSPQQDRSDSRNSNGDHRPLPPLPPFLGMAEGRRNSASSAGLSATAERMMGLQRTLPSPPPASTFSKSDIQNIGNGKMTLEERLKLMMLSDDGKSAAEQQRERRLRRAGGRDRADSQATELELHDDDDDAAGEEGDTVGDLSGLGELQLPPQISRESILRRVDGNKNLDGGSDYTFSSLPSSPERRIALDPDVPIPSTEDAETDEFDASMHLKHEYDDGDSILDHYQGSESELEEDTDDDEEEFGQAEEEVEKNDDSASNYSSPAQAPTPQDEKVDEEQVTTPRASSPPAQVEPSLDSIALGPVDNSSDISKHNPFTDDLQPFMLPKPTEVEEVKASDVEAVPQRPCTPEHLTKPDYDGTGWGDPDEYDEEEPKTPDSVIHRPLPEPEEEEARVSPAIPDTAATIKSAAGSKLKTRPSATPADIATMREQRRIVSREVPDIPAIPDRHHNRLSQILDGSQLLSTGSSTDDYMMRHPSFKARSLTLDLDLGLSLDQDFDRVIEAQKVAFHQFPSQQSSQQSTNLSTPSQALSRQASKARLTKKPVPNANDANNPPRKQRGYLMRQNTKVVAASDKDTEDLRHLSRSAGNSPVKQTRPQSWTVEPWNGQTRKRSIRKKPVPNGPVPPLPGRESNTIAMNPVIEEETAEDATAEDAGERGRLFVKVLGVKDLDLPIPKSE